MKNKLSFDLVSKYIASSWKKAVKPKNFNHGLILPYDYIPPCIGDNFLCLYYWDTYFTNLGLYCDNMTKYAYNNIEDLKYCLRKFGCVPNACYDHGADFASQPPLLFLMVDDYYNNSLDLEFLNDSYDALINEYSFWQNNRLSDNGLNHYGTNFDFYKHGPNLDSYVKRTGIDISNWTKEQKIKKCINVIAEGESGEDYTPRFNGEAFNVNPIDLNTYLYAFECTMARFSNILNNNQEIVWQNRAKTRLDLINKYCYDKQTGIYFDYNYIDRKISNIICVANYLPYVFGITYDIKALNKINDKLVFNHGVVSCEEVKQDSRVYQWGYPNSWAPHNYWAYKANEKLLKNVANDIIKNYITTVATEFSKSDNLYEKYDAIIGGKAVVNEYGVPQMLGWTAGVYQYFYNIFLINNNI